jgi:predicted transcriptional regulator
MPTPKDEVRELLDQLPDDSSLDDIQYHIYVRQKIRNGLAGADQGNLISQQEVEQRMSRWLDK